MTTEQAQEMCQQDLAAMTANNKNPYWPHWIDPKYMDETFGYELISVKDGYLKYQNKAGVVDHEDYGVMGKGKKIIYFNTNYAIDKVFMGIDEDGGTRHVYYGVVKTPEDLMLIIKSVR